MIYVPMPGRPATSLRVAGSVSYRVANVTSQGQIIGWTNRTTSNLVQTFGSRTHRSNKIRFLKPGQPWKPCSDFHIAAAKVSRPDATIRMINPLNGRLKGLRVGPSDGNGHTTGPFMTLTVTDCFVNAIPANTLNRLKTELMLKVGDRKVNYGEALGESRATVKHLANSAMTLARAALSARKGNWWAVARALGVTPRRFKSGKSAAERWLEYQYGWVPLMSDIYDTAQLLDKGFRENKQIMSEVRNITDTDSRTSKDGDSFVGRIYGNSTVNYRAKCYFSIKDDHLARLNQVGLINPLEVAWALVPFSFVVDWMIPVGNYLEALNARFGVDFIDGFYSTRVTGHYTSYLNQQEWPDYKVETHTAVARTDIFGYRRSSMAGFPVPGLYYKNPFSSTHLTSAIALVRQLIR